MISNKLKRVPFRLGLSVSVLGSTLGITAVPMAGAAEIEELLVTGSRRQTISSTEIPSPVDIIDAGQLTAQGASDMSDLIRTVVPSFNVTAHPVSGTSSLVRPPNLAGLGADHTLVLVNGKRRHRAANIPNFSGGINDGTQGPDISNIPAVALKQVEVLRDGAAAQYGADAIAGVMNFVANDDPEARSFEIKLGQHYEGDGDSITVAGTYGFVIGNDGSLNLSAEYTDSDGTDRAQQSTGNQAFTDAGYPDIPDPAIEWGNPEIKGDLKLFANLVAPMSDSVELYGFANYNDRENISGFFFRNPARGGVFAIDSERIVFDTTEGGNTGNGTGNCPALTVPDLSDSAAVQADIAAVAALRNNPSCFSFLEDFPGGTAPRFSGINEDYTLAFGVRGELQNDFSYDVSYVVGENEVTYRTFDNFNPTFGPESPNFLVAGSRIQKEQTFNAQVVYPWEIGVASPLNVAAGFEWREEEYQQLPGQREAWDIGPYTKTAQGTSGIAVGTLGFGSFNPATSYSASRDNIALYIDLETDITDNWILGGALRYEDFDDVGTDTNFKVASLYKLTDNFSIRGTISSSFHAPTPGQQLFAQSSVGFNSAGVLTTNSTLPPGIVAQLPTFADSAQQLTPETANNISLGIAWDNDELSLTVDYYRIDVEDRITLTSTADINDADRSALLELGFTNASQFVGVNFYTNDFDTQTEGVDVVFSKPVTITESGTSNLALAFNYTTTEVTRKGPNLSDLRLLQLEQQLPELKGNISLTHAEDRLSGILRLNYYGPLTEYYLSTTRVTELDKQITVDLELNFDATDNIQLSLGAQNIFDSFPSEAVYSTTFGSTYPVSSPAGFGGGYYYGKLKLTF